MNEETNSLFIGLIAGAVMTTILSVVLILSIHRNQPQSQLGVNNSDSAAQVATSSTMQVGPQEIKTVFAANTSCRNRIVSVLQNDVTVILSLDSDITPSASVGHPVSATTTQSLPANQYGCGAVRAYAAASTTLTITELIQ